MREHSIATAIGRKAVATTKTLRDLWDDGVRANEAMLSGPWDREGSLRWRRRHRGWTLDGSTPPAVPLDPGTEAERTPEEPGSLSPRSGSSSC